MPEIKGLSKVALLSRIGLKETVDNLRALSKDTTFVLDCITPSSQQWTFVLSSMILNLAKNCYNKNSLQQTGVVSWSLNKENLFPKSSALGGSTFFHFCHEIFCHTMFCHSVLFSALSPHQLCKNSLLHKPSLHLASNFMYQT